MTRANVVIGANFGDEGKGLMTDYLSSPSSTVVLFNGGAQRGHTVVTPEGLRHVFHHFGSGSLAGAKTHLSRFFIANPIVFREEASTLSQHVKLSITADPSCRITTPYDMAINQIVEEFRGVSRHGSCGLGINETMYRSCEIPFTARDLTNLTQAKDILTRILREWVFQRLADLGVTTISDKWQSILNSERLMDNFLGDCGRFMTRVTIDRDALLSNRDLIFEAGQGLLLDENHRYFPHVTHSSTGLTNVIILAEEFSIKELDVHYMTRWYTTRHGAGPFETEIEGKPSPLVVDETNIPNMFQGTLRFGKLDLTLLKESIHNDLAQAAEIKVNPYLTVTCLDQSESPEAKIFNDLALIEIPIGHASYGPTRENVRSFRH